MVDPSLGRIADARRRIPLDRITRIRLVTILLILAAYEVVARSGLFFEGVVPSLLAVFAALLRTLADPGFYPHLGRTALEVAIGFPLGVMLGLAAGILFGMSRGLAAVFNPWVQYLAPTPKIVFFPILLLLFGVDMGSKIAMAAISAFFPTAIAAYGGMRQIPPIYLKVARTLNATRLQMLRIVYVPSLVAPILTSLRLALGVAIVGTLLAEIKMSNLGLGYLVIQHYNFLRMPEMYAVLLLTFAIAVGANAAMEWLTGRIEHDRHVNGD